MVSSLSNDSLNQRLCARCELDPDGRAIMFCRSGGTSAWLTVAQLHQRALQRAAELADAGVRPGDVCAFILPSDELLATSLLGALLLGAVPVLLAPPALQQPAEFSSLPRIVDHVVRVAKPRVVVGQPIDGLTSAARFLSLADVTAAPVAALAPAEPTGERLAALQLTSGTTALPRICAWSQRGLVAALDGMAEAMQLRPTDLCVNWTPLYHDMGLVNNFLLCLTTGVPLAMLRPEEFVKAPALWLRALSDTGATITWSPNFGFALAATNVRDADIEGVRLDGVRAFWNAAERVHLGTLQTFGDRFAAHGVRRAALRTNYGCAENVGGATFSGLDGGVVHERVDGHALHVGGVARPVATGEPGTEIVSVGRPYPGLTAAIVGDDGRRLGDGRVGEIVLESPSSMMCYLGDERASAATLRGGSLHTGDLGYSRGGELFWVGRLRERIQVRGKKIDPSEFEAVLARVSGLRAGCFVAFGIDDERLGTQRVVVVSEVRPGTERVAAEIEGEVRRGAALTLGIEVAQVMLVRSGTLSKTSSGKRRHRHFRQLFRDGALAQFAWPSSAASRSRPADSSEDLLEEQLRQIWSQALRLDDLAPDDDFFARGGDSLSALRAVAAMERRWGAPVALATLARAPTIRQMAAVLEGGPPPRSSVMALHRGPVSRGRPPFYCVPPAGMTALVFADLARHLGPQQPFFGLQLPGIEGESRPLETVEEMAARCVADLRTVQATGPYRIGGMCFGGIVAFEMAQQLVGQGESVTLLAILDTLNPPGSLPGDRERWTPRVALGFARAWSRRLRRRLLGNRDERRAERVLAASLRARRAYVPSVYPGRITLFRSSETDVDYENRADWAELTSEELEVVTVAGDHDRSSPFLRGPHIASTAALLADALCRSE